MSLASFLLLISSLIWKQPVAFPLSRLMCHLPPPAVSEPEIAWHAVSGRALHHFWQGVTKDITHTCFNLNAL